MSKNQMVVAKENDRFVSAANALERIGSEEFEAMSYLVDEWIGKEVVMVIKREPEVVMRGVLSYGPGNDEFWGDFLLTNETHRAEFEWLQVDNVAVLEDGTRLLVADSPHCGVGYPEITEVK